MYSLSDYGSEAEEIVEDGLCDTTHLNHVASLRWTRLPLGYLVHKENNDKKAVG